MSFDWVTARAKCSPTTIAQLVFAQIDADVDRMNAIAEEQRLNVHFAANRIHRDRIAIVRHSGGFDQTVLIQLDAGALVATLDQLPIVRAVVRMNPEGKCILAVRDGVSEVELEIWQFCRRALEGLFFGS